MLLIMPLYTRLNSNINAFMNIHSNNNNNNIGVCGGRTSSSICKHRRHLHLHNRTHFKKLNIKKKKRVSYFNIATSASSSAYTIIIEYAFTFLSLSACASCGNYLGKKNPIGKKLTGPVTSMLLGYLLLSKQSILSGAGGIDSLRLLSLFNADAVINIRLLVSTLATPLILLGANLTSIRKTCSTLLLPFLYMALSTVIGAFLGSNLFLKSIRDKNLASALVAKNIGSGINYVASCEALGVPASDASHGLVLDNVFAFLYFPLVSIIADRLTEQRTTLINDYAVTTSNYGHEKEEVEVSLRFADFGTAFAFGLFILAIARFVCSANIVVVGSDSIHKLFLPIATMFSILCASFLKISDSIVRAGSFAGNSLLYIFFASAGAASPPLLQAFTKDFSHMLFFATTMFGVHILAILFAALAFKKKMIKEILVASNAGIGGPATACAFAKSKDWTHLIAPAILVGNFGNAIATFIALMISKVL
jgi:uncharacterized membrane protein